MITRDELKEFSSISGFSLYQQEKDYFQHLILYSVYSKPDKRIVFRGGTALQKAYGLNRYSEDLDFSVDEDVDFEEVVAKAKKYLSLCGYDATAKACKGWDLSNSFKISIAGPLYVEKESSLCTITLDFSRRSVPGAKIVNTVPGYADIPQYHMVVATLDELLADKIIAMLKRESARDLYDTYFLLEKGAVVNLALLNMRLAYWKEKVGKKELCKKMEKRLEKIEKIWKRELSSFIPYVPEFGEYSLKVLETLKEM